ncbi:alpha/beta hydrolase [Kitasatospora sp. NBC_00240]|uniref:alpha/beta fold hydrolase n=1 Tax=Kitasatospora sp. NBC_00240 TaxID=2903567 RepID=UPI0022552557|nr:alpha/beta hydrolase [Kitasatospora sp. NBC_00240]MCX5208784.1 alpha/beta hydrolase [Kitasatospora sp. NBC_00240]
MSIATVGGTRLHYDDSPPGGRADGEPVVLVMGAGGRGRAWHLHQVPALTAAGYRVITYDSRGVPPSDPGEAGLTVGDLAADLAGLIEHLDAGPCRLVGTSLGAHVVQELLLTRPDLATAAVLMATRGRDDELRAAAVRAEIELMDSGITLPPRYHAALQALQNLSPHTLNDDLEVSDWLSVFEQSLSAGPGLRHQTAITPDPGRLAAYARITTPCLVIGFADDLVTPPHLVAEVARAIPGAAHRLVHHAGHYGYLEQPEEVNRQILAFFAGVPDRPLVRTGHAAPQGHLVPSP